jgi:hypothetical protein
MRTAIVAATMACLLAATACKSTTVHGPYGESVTATTPASVVVRRGESVPLEVGIDRDRFSGPVTVTITQLPKGVEADRAKQTVETASAVFSLKAANNADLVANQQVGVTVSAMDGQQAKHYVALTVTDR